MNSGGSPSRCSQRQWAKPGACEICPGSLGPRLSPWPAPPSVFPGFSAAPPPGSETPASARPRCASTPAGCRRSVAGFSSWPPAHARRTPEPADTHTGHTHTTSAGNQNLLSPKSALRNVLESTLLSMDSNLNSVSCEAQGFSAGIQRRTCIISWSCLWTRSTDTTIVHVLIQPHTSWNAHAVCPRVCVLQSCTLLSLASYSSTSRFLSCLSSSTRSDRESTWGVITQQRMRYWKCLMTGLCTIIINDVL